MIARQLEAWLQKVIDCAQVIHLLGLRQTGKTTLMDAFRQRFPGALYYPLYDLVILRKYESQPEKWVLELEEALKKVGQQDRLQVFVDEIQKIPAFFQGIQGLYEKYKGKIKFWIWGSSARPLKRQRAETLAGRSLSKTLWPFSQAELRQKDSCLPYLFERSKLEKLLDTAEPRDYLQSLTKWLRQTMLPEPSLMENLELAHELIQSYQATYLENEIRRENLVDDIGRFEQFLALAAGENTNIVDYAAKARVLGISPHTVKAYYGILEDTFVCRKISAYSKSLRVQIRKSPKIYFSDTSLARFIAGERGLPSEGSAQFGKLVEGFVVMEVVKQLEYHNLPWKLSYLRTKSDMEIDLIVGNGTEKVGVEIKASRKISSADYQALQTLMALDPEVKYGLVFSLQSAPLRLEKNIINFPIWNL